MDFNDSPEEAAYRKAAQDWLAANAPKAHVGGDPEGGENAGEGRPLVDQLGVGQCPRVAGDRTHVMQRRLIPAPRLDVPVDCVVTGVQYAVGIPAIQRGGGVVADDGGCVRTPVGRPSLLLRVVAAGPVFRSRPMCGHALCTSVDERAFSMDERRRLRTRWPRRRPPRACA